MRTFTFIGKTHVVSFTRPQRTVRTRKFACHVQMAFAFNFENTEIYGFFRCLRVFMLVLGNDENDVKWNSHEWTHNGDLTPSNLTTVSSRHRSIYIL